MRKIGSTRDSTINSGRAIIGALLCSTALVAVSMAQAQSAWDGSVNTNWNRAGNWSTGAVPTNADTVVINDAGLGNQPIVRPGPAQADLTRIEAGTLTVKGQLTSPLVRVLGTGGLTIGRSGEIVGTVRVEDGTGRNRGTITGGLNVTGGTAVSSGTITGPVNVRGTGALTLGGTGSVAGPVTVAETGALTLTGGTAIDDTATVRVNGGTLSLEASEVIGSLAGTGGAVNLGTSHLTTGGAGTNTGYAGAVTGATGSALVKTGAGVMTLSGRVTTTGALRVEGGTLALTGAALDAPSARSAQVTGGTLGGTATLALTGGYAQSGGRLGAALTVNAAGTKALTGGTIAGTLGGPGATRVSGGTVTVTGTIAGDVLVRDATLVLGQSDAVAGTLTVRQSVLRYADGVTEASALVLDGAETRLEVLGDDTATQAGAIS